MRVLGPQVSPEPWGERSEAVFLRELEKPRTERTRWDLGVLEKRLVDHLSSYLQSGFIYLHISFVIRLNMNRWPEITKISGRKHLVEKIKNKSKGEKIIEKEKGCCFFPSRKGNKMLTSLIRKRCCPGKKEHGDTWKAEKTNFHT